MLMYGCGYGYAIALARIISEIDRVTRVPVLVGIDGQSGAGKSTLARGLAQRLGVDAALISGDDFYRDLPERERAGLSPREGYDRYFDWQRLRAEVLVPVSQAASELRYQRYDWTEGRMGEWVQSPMPAVVIVEGVYILRSQLRDLVDVAIYVDTSERTRHARRVVLSANSAEWIRRWSAAEQYYLATDDPQSVAAIVVSGARLRVSCRNALA